MGARNERHGPTVLNVQQQSLQRGQPKQMQFHIDYVRSTLYGLWESFMMFRGQLHIKAQQLLT